MYSFFLILFVLNGASLMGQSPPADTSRDACIKEATRLLDEALVIMQKHYYKKDSIQWEPLISNAKDLLYRSSDCENAYKAVQWCFDQIKEKHSYVMPPVKAAIYNGNINSSSSGSSHKRLTGDIHHELIDGNIAYISVPWIATTDRSVCTRFADSIQHLIKTFDQSGINKWIIDLRKNTGGNCWPMLAGLGSLLGNGTHGFFVSSKDTIPINYKDGVIMQGKHARCAVSNPYTLLSKNKTIVVLTGENTASAGEIVVIAFKGMKDVYLYGEPTAGLTTANASYPLSDGSMLVLTVCKEADRTGKIIEGKIHPDELVKSSLLKGNDEIKAAALMFLQMR
jgi:hypothetical protein